MQRSARRLCVGCALIVGAVFGVPVAPLSATDPPTTGWYVVRPGDTLHSITAQFLGSSQAWPKNWSLNPEVADPDRLRPGQRLRILVGESLPRKSAQVIALERKVEANPVPLEWKPAAIADLLRERDGLRTERASSAELELASGNRMVVTENSLVYLREEPQPKPQAARQTIEIVRGQADLEGRDATATPGASPGTDVEIVVGGARTRPRGNAAQAAQARARLPEAGGAQVMVYRGEGEVEAGGKAVALATGTGTSVAPGGEPGPPETLLPAPTATAPPAGARLGFGNPRLVWEAVPGAVAYVVEICWDARCARLIERVLGHAATEYRAAALPVGELFWRSTAVSPSGLDGYPAEGRALTILDSGEDAEAPRAEIVVVGPSKSVAGEVFLAPGARLELASSDTGSGVAIQEISFDGEPVAAAALDGPFAPGRHEVRIAIEDGVGNRRDLTPFTFAVDETPPALDLEVVAKGWRAETEVAAKAWPIDRAVALGATGKKAKAGRLELEWSMAGAAWQALDRLWEVRGGAGSLVLRAVGGAFSVPEKGLEVGEGQWLRIRLGDEGVGLERARFRFEAAAAGGGVLTLMLQDELGNETERRLELRAR